MMTVANKYRTHLCGELRDLTSGKNVRVSGWVENIRDHGGVMFLDVRDQYGVVQVVVHDQTLLQDVNKECSVTIRRQGRPKDEETYNPKIATGTVEIVTESLEVLGKCKNTLPFEVMSSTERKRMYASSTVSLICE